MRSTFGPARLAVLDVPAGLRLAVFRIVRSDAVGDPEFLDSLRSNYELGRPPRNIEHAATIIRMGISVYLKSDVASGTVRRWPKLGQYVARLELTEGHGFNFAHTGPPDHLTLWGDPVKLRDAVVDIDRAGS